METIPKKPVRTKSGVTPLTVVLKPRKCDHGTCIYCPGGDYVPQSYTDKSPAIMRAMALSYDPYAQTMNRLHVLTKMGHPTDKIEIILLGGTFLQYDRDYQYMVVKRIFDALNGRDAPDLLTAQQWNETANHRCVALCIENRPDNCSDEEIALMRSYGATRVEIGVQILDDAIYKKIHRGHSVQDVVDATKRLKNAGFKVGYHIMPGLPYSTPAHDLEQFKMLFEDERFRPDQLKLYPCQIVKDSPLALTYQKIGFLPYDEETTKMILSEMYQLIPRYCRVMRIMREIPKEKMVVPPLRLDLRKDVEAALKKNPQVTEIRLREVGFRGKVSGEIVIRVTEYVASGGTEFFLELIDAKETLLGLLRLRFPDQTKISEVFDSALIRELHVYGDAKELGVKGTGSSQHSGFGTLLLETAEKIAKEHNFKRIAIISGVGVRGYYVKRGYTLDGTYMVKNLDFN